MYGKVFQTIYDGSLVECWEALVTFQQLICLADSEGVVDITPEALHRKTNIPLEVIKKGIEHLEAPDPQSRTPAEDGRRIVRLDDHRSWGWLIVNHTHYRNLASREQKRENDKERMRQKRAKESVSQCVAGCRDASQASQSVVNVAHTYTDTYTDRDNKHSTRFASSSESSAAAPDPPIDGKDVVLVPYGGGVYQLTRDGKAWSQYATTYPWDVEQELRKAAQWLRDNKNRRPKSTTSLKAFLTRWLNRCDEKRQAVAGRSEGGGHEQF